MVLVLKRLRRWGLGLKSRPTDWEKRGIEYANLGLQDIGPIHHGCFRLSIFLFVAVFLGYNQYWSGGLMVLWLYVQEHQKAQPTVDLILKRLRRRGHGIKSHPTDWEKAGNRTCYPWFTRQRLGVTRYCHRFYEHLKLHFRIYLTEGVVSSTVKILDS